MADKYSITAREILRLYPGGEIVGISIAHFPKLAVWQSTDHPDLKLKRFLDDRGFARLTALARLESLGADRVMVRVTDKNKQPVYPEFYINQLLRPRRRFEPGLEGNNGRHVFNRKASSRRSQ